MTDWIVLVGAIVAFGVGIGLDIKYIPTLWGKIICGVVWGGIWSWWITSYIASMLAS